MATAADLIIISANHLEPIRYESVVPTTSVMQELVGGDMEYIPAGDDWAAICNEEGMMMGLPVNGRAVAILADFAGYDPAERFCGPVVLVGVRGDETVSVPERIAAAIKGVFTN